MTLLTPRAMSFAPSVLPAAPFRDARERLAHRSISETVADACTCRSSLDRPDQPRRCAAPTLPRDDETPVLHRKLSLHTVLSHDSLLRTALRDRLAGPCPRCTSRRGTTVRTVPTRTFPRRCGEQREFEVTRGRPSPTHRPRDSSVALHFIDPPCSGARARTRVLRLDAFDDNGRPIEPVRRLGLSPDRTSLLSTFM